LVKYETVSDTVVGTVELGLFPATIGVPPHGTVEVIDLDSGTRVASATVGKQAGGIALWKVES